MNEDGIVLEELASMIRQNFLLVIVTPSGKNSAYSRGSGIIPMEQIRLGLLLSRLLRVSDRMELQLGIKIVVV